MPSIPNPLQPPERLLLGPGPSPVPAPVSAALSLPTIGHLDPRFLEIMDEIRAMLRAVFGTRNELTLPISGTGSAGMEAMLANLVRPGDELLIGVAGVFGGRMAEAGRRLGARVTACEGEWGRALDPAAMRAAAAGRRFRFLAAVHGETSTGVLQEVEPLRELADELGALLLLDCVTTLGGVSVELDARGVDAAFSGTQKCLSCPPGLAPLSLGARARELLAGRSEPPPSWYFDLGLLSSYWGSERAYHHTAPIQMLYGIHEALRLVLAEGLDERIARHERHARALWAGLEALGLELLVPEHERLAPLTSVRVPSGVDEAAVRRRLLEEHSIEIGGGLGPLKGSVWRIGLMGGGASRANVELLLCALRSALVAEGAPAGDPHPALAEAYAEP